MSLGLHIRHILVLSLAWLQVGLAGVAAPPTAEAAGVWMQEHQIRAELVGLKLTGVYPGGLAWSEVIEQDGRTDYRERGMRRLGRWRIAGELFCFSYAEPMQGGCFRIVKRGPNCYELYTASIGDNLPPRPPPAEDMAWNGRMWRDNARHTCDRGAIS